MGMKVEIRVYGKEKYYSKRCSHKVTKNICSIKAVFSNKEVKELEKTLGKHDIDGHGQYYKIIDMDGDESYYRASHTRIMRYGEELLLTKYDILFSDDYYKHHTATIKVICVQVMSEWLKNIVDALEMVTLFIAK